MYQYKYVFLQKIDYYIMKTANYTDLRANLKTYIDAVINDAETVIVNRGGGKGVVMISLEEYNSIKETEYIMRSPAMVDAIKRGEKEIAKGEGVKIDMDELWK